MKKGSTTSRHWRKKLRSAREDAKLTYLEIANLFGVSIDTVRSWAYGKRPIPLYAQRLIQLLEDGKL